MTSTAPGALQIECAKPDCTWKGSPAEAPTHPCPTPAESTGDAEREALTATLAAAGVTYDPKTSLEGLRELAALATGDQTPLEETIAETAEPTTREELEAWLVAHGDYGEDGTPQNEKTATLDARLVGLMDADPEPEPELEDDEPLEGEIVSETEEPTVAPAALENAGPRPWEVVIAAALENQQAVKEYRWLIVWIPADATREAELIGRGKVKNEALVIQEDVAARGELTGEIRLVKTADVLAAAEVERKRTNVETEEPEVVETPAEPIVEPQETPAEPEPTEEVKAAAQAAQAAQPAPGETSPAGASLFDASDYDREDLAIPKVDGFGIDRIGIDFGGGVMLDRSEPAHVGLYNRVRMGQDLELWITAKGAGTGAKPATNREGDLDVIVGKKALRVESIRILRPEDLGAAEASETLRAAARKANAAGMTDDQIEEAVVAALAEIQ